MKETERLHNNANSKNNYDGRPQPELVIPSPSDFPDLAVMLKAAFQEKNGCSSTDKAINNALKAYQQYRDEYPQKLEHCRVIKQNGIVMAGCQLQVAGDPGDFSFPAYARHELQPGEVYVEWIACHPDHTGKGLGSMLLRWATDFATHTVGAKVLTLDVMKKNVGAVRLYERKGFCIKQNKDAVDAFFEGLLVFCCLGCKYWTVLNMEKPLEVEPETK
ncbi:FR47-like protein [Seminavis robusta]|uniref:FR47-like protein n=1 Tax=Seminavis robusta TaxID=568900 RepID=A0A9N8EL09_9STRA|nr:FR47-like protein [Seminavis robusta]|eukprot:Sro1447_g273600.1 FR47-like protein (218) ;mRNA; r:25636-26289